MTPILYGSTGYIGSEFRNQIADRGWDVFTMDHSIVDENWLFELAKINGAESHVLINCAAFIPQPSVSACNDHHRETFKGNVFFPALVADACENAGIPIMHLSTGCLFDEAKDYTEEDEPMRGWKDHCGYYVGTKLLAEDIVSGYEKHWICRIRLPFDEQDNPRNYLSKLIKYPQVYDHDNSLCHRADIVRAMLDMIEKRVPFGTYHVANVGHIRAAEIVNAMYEAGVPGVTAPCKQMIPGPCTGTRLSVEKLLSTGIKIRSVQEAVNDAIVNWTKA